MEKISKYIAVIILASILLFVMGCGGSETGTTTELATLKGTYKLEEQTDFSNIAVWVSGPQVYPSMNTNVSGNFTLQVEAGTYTVQASKTSFDNSTTTGIDIPAGSTYDLGIIWLGSSSPPGPPPGL